jgi:hypothetical protein
MLQRFKQWLAPTTYTSRYEDAQSLRTPSTSQWIFDDPAYKNWLAVQDSSALLWIHGELLYFILTTKNDATHSAFVRKTWRWKNNLGGHSCRTSQRCGCESILFLFRLSSIILQDKCGCIRCDPITNPPQKLIQLTASRSHQFHHTLCHRW